LQLILCRSRREVCRMKDRMRQELQMRAIPHQKDAEILIFLIVLSQFWLPLNAQVIMPLITALLLAFIHWQRSAVLLQASDEQAYSCSNFDIFVWNWRFLFCILKNMNSVASMAVMYQNAMCVTPMHGKQIVYKKASVTHFLRLWINRYFVPPNTTYTQLGKIYLKWSDGNVLDRRWIK
jgi:hypothetical protein